jgi:hypothetical protein
MYIKPNFTYVCAPIRSEYRGKHFGYIGYFAYKGYSGPQCLEGGFKRKDLNCFIVKEREEGRGQNNYRTGK